MNEVDVFGAFERVSVRVLAAAAAAHLSHLPSRSMVFAVSRTFEDPAGGLSRYSATSELETFGGLRVTLHSSVEILDGAALDVDGLVAEVMLAMHAVAVASGDLERRRREIITTVQGRCERASRTGTDMRFVSVSLEPVGLGQPRPFEFLFEVVTTMPDPKLGDIACLMSVHDAEEFLAGIDGNLRRARRFYHWKGSSGRYDAANDV